MTGVKNERYDLGLTEYDPEVWPQSVNHYRIETSFVVTAHNERQALLRWREFQAVLDQLAGNEWHAHEIVRYVSSDGSFPSDEKSGPSEKMTLLETMTVDAMPQGSMASGLLPHEAWLDPYSDDDFDPIVAANSIFFATPPDEEDIENQWPPLTLEEEVGEDGTIRRVNH